MLAVAHAPGWLFIALVIGSAVVAAGAVLRICFDPATPQDQNAKSIRAVVGVLSLGWIGLFTLISIAGGGFIGFLNLAPLFLLGKLKDNAV